MSLILDALRKSEAERRRGQAPDVFAATPGAPPARAPAPRVWPLLLLGAMLLGSAWLIWQAGGERGESVPDGDADRALPRDAVDAPAGSPPPRIIVVPAPAPPPPVARPSRSADAQSPLPTAVAPTPSPTPAAAPPLLAPVPVPDAVATEPELPPVAVLDAATRAALPPLKLTMHVYADDPARRFAIVDGQRVAEGARLGAAVVAQIRRDGVVIDVDGRRLLLPKP
jgi:general secretion pathway protein B